MSLYNVGDLAVLDFSVADPILGNPIDPSSASLSVTAPDGSVAAAFTLAQMTRLDVGQYRATVPVMMRGVYVYRWTATGIGQSSTSGQLSVGMSLVRLTEVKAELNYRSIDVADDDELVGFILAATEAIEELCGPVLPRPVVDTIVAPAGVTGTYLSPTLLLQQYPVLSVESVVTGSATSSTTLDPSTYVVDGSGRLVRTGAGSWGQRTVINYTAGRRATPATVRLACLELIAHWWQSSQQSRPAGGSSIVGTYDDVDTQPATPDTGIPFRVLIMLRAYRRAPSVA